MACLLAANAAPRRNRRLPYARAVLRMDLEVNRVDPRFHGQFSLDFKTPLTADVLEALPRRPLAFDVTPEYVFRMLGVRVK